MKKQAFNPYLPSYEYVPDGEPYVFGDKLYVFGSHDAFNAKGKEYMNAPDVCVGPDGRYYLYYQLHLEVVTSVAVADRPEGPYEFYGHVKYADGTLYGKKKGDAYNFDPGVLLDDDGRVYMYTGFCPDKGIIRFAMGIKGGALDGGYVVELNKDMLTVTGKQYETVPGVLRAKGTEFEGHGFYEASSIRKINGLYYLVYSSILSHELCYATSKSPTGPWKYGGTLVSIGDIGLSGVTAENPRNYLGNTHGGMACVKGQWYIFYHRQTNQQKCARQGCAEPITIAADGSIGQAEVTSCGLNGKPLVGKGTYGAYIACNLSGKEGVFAYVKPHHKEKGYPYFTQSGTDRECDGDQYIANMTDGATAGFKYFEMETPVNRISVRVRGNMEGRFLVRTLEKGVVVGKIPVRQSRNWNVYQGNVNIPVGIHALYFQYEGQGVCDMMEFTLE